MHPGRCEAHVLHYAVVHNSTYARLWQGLLCLPGVAALPASLSKGRRSQTGTHLPLRQLHGNMV